MYTSSMENIYLSLRARVAVGTFFMKSTVLWKIPKNDGLQIKQLSDKENILYLVPHIIHNFTTRKWWVKIPFIKNLPNIIIIVGVFVDTFNIWSVCFALIWHGFLLQIVDAYPSLLNTFKNLQNLSQKYPSPPPPPSPRYYP